MKEPPLRHLYHRRDTSGCRGDKEKNGAGSTVKPSMLAIGLTGISKPPITTVRTVAVSGPLGLFFQGFPKYG